MISSKLVNKDLEEILGSNNFNASYVVPNRQKEGSCYFNDATKIIFEDGTVAFEITALLRRQNNDDIRARDLFYLREEGADIVKEFEITKKEVESKFMLRLFLKKIRDYYYAD